MGKWTPNYVDDVLHGKISNLVSGSIRRAAVEKESSTITYENFVNALDTGDSFTASLIDILVKELADRRTRNNAHDRTLIAEHTIRSLRQLASSARCYSTHNPIRARARRAANLTHYPTNTEMYDPEFEEDDEFDVMMENPTIIEGVRVNSDLHDAFSPSTSPWPPSPTRRITASPPAEDLPLPQPTRPSVTRSFTAASVASTSAPPSLTRQASVHRAVRSRLVDFHDRRRPYAREIVGPRPAAHETVTEPRETPYSMTTVRRFFPRVRRNQTNSIPWSERSDSLSPDSDDPAIAFFALTHDEMNTNRDPVSASPDAENPEETEHLLRAPRLRYLHNLPAPSPFSRRASPLPAPRAEENTAAARSLTSSPHPESGPFFRIEASEEPVAYPSPRSTENENVS